MRGGLIVSALFFVYKTSSHINYILSIFTYFTLSRNTIVEFCQLK